MPDVYCLFNRARGSELVSPADVIKARQCIGRARRAEWYAANHCSAGMSAVGGQPERAFVRPSLRQRCSGCTVQDTRRGQGVSGCHPWFQTNAHPHCLPQITQTLVRLANEHSDGISVVDAARLAGLPPSIAREHLLSAESAGKLCRDDAPDGLRFFDNKFMKDFGA